MRAGQLATTVSMSIEAQFQILGKTKMPRFCGHSRNRRNLERKKKTLRSFKVADERSNICTCLFAFFTPRPHEDGSIVRNAQRGSVAIYGICQLPDNDYDG